MRFFLKIMSAFLFVMLVGGCNSNNTTTKSVEASDTWSFNINGDVGTAVHNEDSSYLVTYYGVENALSVESGNPDEDLGVNNIDSMIDNWDKVQKNNNRTAVLHYSLEDGSAKDVVVKIKNPSYDKTRGVFQFTVVPVDSNEMLDTNLLDISLKISGWDWTQLGLACGGSIVSIIAAAVQAGLDPLSDAIAAGATGDCILEIKKVFGD